MASPKKKFPGRHEEQPAVAKFLHTSYVRDLALFSDYSGDFNEAYGNEFNKKIADTNEVVFPEKLTKEGKKVTERILANLERLKVLNKLTESYVKRAGSALTVSPDDFGCKALRKSLNSGDVEAVIKNLRTLLQNIDANLELLTQKGLKAAVKAELAALPDSFTNDNTLQNSNAQARNKLVNENVTLFDALFDIMRDVSETGKVIHKTLSGTPERAADYVMAGLLKKVRNERKEIEIISPKTN